MNTRTKSILHFVVLSVCAGFFSACSSSDGSRKITVDAGFKVGSSTPYNLSEKLLTHRLNLVPATCVQDQLRLAVHDHTTDQIVSIQPIVLHSNLPGAAPTPSATPQYISTSADIDKAIDWIANYSYLDSPLSITVPSGPDEYDIALIGEFFYPQDTYVNATLAVGSDGVCDQVTTGNSALALGSSAIFGKASVARNQTGTLSLPIAVVQTNPTDNNADYALTNNQGYFAKFDKNFNDGSNVGPLYQLKRVRYLDGAIDMKVDNGAWTYFFPSVFPHPYEMTFEDANSAKYVSTTTFATNCVGCGLIPDPAMYSGTATFTNGVHGAISVTSGSVTGTINTLTVSVTFAATNGVCTGTVNVLTGSNSFGGDAGNISFSITSPNFIGSGTLPVSGYTVGPVGTYTGPCPTVSPWGGYGITQK